MIRLIAAYTQLFHHQKLGNASYSSRSAKQEAGIRRLPSLLSSKYRFVGVRKMLVSPVRLKSHAHFHHRRPQGHHHSQLLLRRHPRHLRPPGHTLPRRHRRLRPLSRHPKRRLRLSGAAGRGDSQDHSARGETLRHLNPDERTTAALLKKALAVPATPEWAMSTSGIFVRTGGLAEVLADLKDARLIYLREDGADIRSLDDGGLWQQPFR